MKFELNAKTYEVEGFTFGTLCELENRKISLNDIQDKPMTFLREFISINTGLSSKDVEKEIEGHIINNGSLTEVMDNLSEIMEQSGFFQKLTEMGNSKGKKKASKTSV